MSDSSQPVEIDDLVAHLASTTGLPPAQSARVVAEVVAFFSEPVDDYVRRRHRELQSRGLRNEEAFRRISAELPARRFTCPDMSLRQLRRIVYG